MAGVARIAGGLLVAIGLVVAVASTTRIVRDDDYSKKALIATRNPGNAMYEMEFGAARVRRGFQLVFLSGGVLLALNGATLMLLGSLATRVARHERPG